MQSQTTIKDVAKQNVNIYTNGWQTRLNKLGNLVATSPVATFFLAVAASEVLHTTELKAWGSESIDFASSSFEY